LRSCAHGRDRGRTHHQRTQALGLELFTNLGIDPTQKKLVVVKSTNHFMAAFGPIAKKVL
jgi:microcystin degradation protein MlrC